MELKYGFCICAFSLGLRGYASTGTHVQYFISRKMPSLFSKVRSNFAWDIKRWRASTRVSYQAARNVTMHFLGKRLEEEEEEKGRRRQYSLLSPVSSFITTPQMGFEILPQASSSCSVASSQPRAFALVSNRVDSLSSSLGIAYVMAFT